MPWYTQNPILWPGKSRINIDKLFDFEIPPEYHLDKGLQYRPPTLLVGGLGSSSQLRKIGKRQPEWNSKHADALLQNLCVVNPHTFSGSGSDPCSLIKKGFS